MLRLSNITKAAKKLKMLTSRDTIYYNDTYRKPFNILDYSKRYRAVGYKPIGSIKYLTSVI
jgi:hypothetical protein